MASNIVFDGTKGISLPSFTTTEKNAIVSPATGATVFDTTQNRQNVYAGGVWNAGLNSGTAVASTSGTSIDFTGIPSWVKRVTVIFQGVSLSATASYLIQLGTSGGVATSGYASCSILGVQGGTTGGTTSSSGLLITSTGNAAHFVSGTMTLNLISGNTWVGSHAMGFTNTSQSCFGGGSIALSGALTTVRINTTATDSFDAGSINILYE